MLHTAIQYDFDDYSTETEECVYRGTFNDMAMDIHVEHPIDGDEYIKHEGRVTRVFIATDDDVLQRIYKLGQIRSLEQELAEELNRIIGTHNAIEWDLKDVEVNV